VKETADSRTQHPRARPLHCDCVTSARIWFLDQGEAVISVSSSSRMIHNRHTLCRRPSEPLPLRCQSIRPRAQHGSILLFPAARVMQWVPPISNFESKNLKISQDRIGTTQPQVSVFDSMASYQTVVVPVICPLIHPSSYSVVTGNRQLTESPGHCRHTLISCPLTFIWRISF
jgi:hypothetical protein